MANKSEVIIPVDLDTKKFDDKIQKLENKAKKVTRDIERETSQKELFEQSFNASLDRADELEKKIEDIKNKTADYDKLMEDAVKDYQSSDKSFAEKQYLDERIRSLEYTKAVEEAGIKDIVSQIDLERTKQNEIALLIQKQEDKIKSKSESLKEINNDLNSTIQKQQEYKEKIEQTNKEQERHKLKEIQKQLNDVGQATNGVIRKIIKWGLALFSIRSAYNFIRSAVSTLAGTNEQIGADIEYIRWALATTLQPIIETLINLAYTLLQYINYIANAWFGVNLFAKATAENFKKTKDGVKGVNTEAKKLQKTLAGFDEMNILQENGSTSAGGGGGGIGNIMPSTDLSQMLPDVEIPGWIKWIAENGEFLASIIVGIGGAFATWQILELLDHLKLLGDGFTGFQQLLVTLGIGLIFKGIYDVVTDWGEHIETVIGDVGEIITGFGIMLVGIDPKAWWGWAILGVGFLLDLVPHIFDTRDATEKLKDAQDKLNESQQEYINASKNQLNAFKNAKQAEDDLTKAGEALGLSKEETKKKAQELYDLIKDKGISAYDELSDSDKKLYDAYLNELDAQDRLKKANKEVSDAKKQEVKDNLEVQKYIAITTGNYKDYGDAIVKAYKEGAISSGEAGVRMGDVLKNLDNETKKTFVTDMPWQVAQFSNSFKNAMDAISGTTNIFSRDIPYSVEKSMISVDNLKDKLNIAYSIFKKFTGVNIKATVNSSGGIVTNAKGGIVTKLATGGIVNRPGRGVPVANSYMGEAGREGILPLTDSQAMETLGQAIGRYISLNATIPIYMGNRQIAREIQKIQAEDDFAYNGG